MSTYYGIQRDALRPLSPNGLFLMYTTIWNLFVPYPEAERKISEIAREITNPNVPKSTLYTKG